MIANLHSVDLLKFRTQIFHKCFTVKALIGGIELSLLSA
jgi:hypothetical protein